tara:strand:- start:24 stop:491 length:468 start_codon:yes stop_codon:yes gene_type:complete
MKKSIFTLSLLIVALLGFNFNAAAQTTAEVSTEILDGAQIKVDKDVHDYGTMEQGGNGECIFTVTNTGNAPLLITLCKGSCGCTVPTCPKEPIAPGASATITVRYDTKRVGPINKSVTITTNAVNEPRKVVRIKGNIKAKPQGSAPVNTGTPTNN